MGRSSPSFKIIFKVQFTQLVTFRVDYRLYILENDNNKVIIIILLMNPLKLYLL